jgi:hypothetical protein
MLCGWTCRYAETEMEAAVDERDRLAPQVRLKSCTQHTPSHTHTHKHTHTHIRTHASIHITPTPRKTCTRDCLVPRWRRQSGMHASWRNVSRRHRPPTMPHARSVFSATKASGYSQAVQTKRKDGFLIDRQLELPNVSHSRYD